MDDMIRQADWSHACPRCGRPVTYKGRGRRPVWCSSTCRVEASIERKGNRVVGVQPQVVRVEGPPRALTRHELELRERVEREMPDRVAVARVAASPALLERLLGELHQARDANPGEPGDLVARRLVRAAERLQPGITTAASSPLRANKRRADEWAQLLSELASLLRTGQFYERDLPTIDEPMNQLASVYLRRSAAALGGGLFQRREQLAQLLGAALGGLELIVGPVGEDAEVQLGAGHDG